MTIQTKNVTTPELRLGDVVHCHGGRFQLVSYLVDAETAAERAAYIRRHGSHYGPEDAEREAQREESLRAFGTDYLGPMDARWPCAIPEHWRSGPDHPHGWTVQGNHLAMWSVEVAA